MINLQSEIDINRAWEITPYNGLGYGAVVVILILVAYYFKNQNEKANDYIQAQNERLHSIAEETINKVGEIKQDREIKHEKVMNILENIIDKLKRLDNLKM